MQTVVSIVTLLALVIFAAVLGWFLFKGTVRLTDEAELLRGCLPAPLTKPVPPGVVLSDRAAITIEEGRFSITLKPLQKELYLRGPVITLVAGSIAKEPHNVVVAFTSGNCAGKVIRQLNDVTNGEFQSLRLSLARGEYLIYCDRRKGAVMHRDEGEQMKLFVY